MIAGGNFARKMQTNMMKRKDDFGQLAGTLETMRESVCGLLAQVKKEAANIDNVVESMDTNISNLNGKLRMYLRQLSSLLQVRKKLRHRQSRLTV